MKEQKALLFSFITLMCLCVNAQSNIEKLKDYISGSQLVIYSESSYMTDNSASSITYTNFCPNGRYNYSYDGSFTGKGTQHTSNENNRVYGAGLAENEGNWSVLEYQDGYYLEIVDYTGTKSYYPIHIQQLLAGKWIQGQTTYVFAPGSGKCQ